MTRARAVPDDLALAVARAERRLGPFAADIAWFPEVASTNDIALRRAEAGAPEGALVVADAQSRGRGRFGRPWASPAGAGIYASVLLRPDVHRSMLTLAAGVAVAEGIEAAAGLRTTLKWPNDIYASASLTRKLGGILAEAGASNGRRPYVVIGIGINVRRSSYPPDVAPRATSLEDELGRPIDRALLLVESLAALWRRYGELQHGQAEAVRSAWSERGRATFGRHVEWHADHGVETGVAEGVSADGALRVRMAGGGQMRIVSGEVRWTS